jgi:flagellar biosynthesis GTPase FlhF
MMQVQQNAFREHLNTRGAPAASATSAPSGVPASVPPSGAAEANTNAGATKPRTNRRERRQSAVGMQEPRGPPPAVAERDVVSLSTFDGTPITVGYSDSSKHNSDCVVILSIDADSFSAPSLAPPPPINTDYAQQQSQQRRPAPQPPSASVQSSLPPRPVSGYEQQYAPSAPASVQPGYPPHRDPVGSVLSEIQREDPGLWPSLSTLLDELMSVLQGLSERTQMLDTRLEVRTALAMAARVKVVCTSSATGRTVAAAAAEARSDFPADKLMKELNRYSVNPAARADTSEERSPSSVDAKDSVDRYVSVADEAGARDSRGRLQALAGRVKLIETDLKDDNVPERHLYLLRDLRMRVIEVEKALADELSSREAQWATERRDLQRKAEENERLAEQVRQGQSESMSAMRQRYEESLRNAEEALESGTRAASQELARLQSVIAQQQQLLQLYEQRQPVPAAVPSAASVASASSRGSSIPSAQSAPPAVVPAAGLSAVSQSQAVQTVPLQMPAPVPSPSVSAQNLSEFLRMQRLVDQTGDHLEYTRQQRQQIEEVHARELAELKSHFARFRRAQAEVVRSLEDQLRELHDKHSAPVLCRRCGTVNDPPAVAPSDQAVEDALTGGPSMAAQLKSLADAEDIIRKMEFRFRMKAAELYAVMTTLSRMATGEGETGSVRGNLDQSSYVDMSASFDAIGIAMSQAGGPGGRAEYGGQTSARAEPRGGHTAGAAPDDNFDAVAREMQVELYEARIATAEKEIEVLHRNLKKERTLVAALKTQLEAAGEAANAATGMSGRSLSVPRAAQLSGPKGAEEPVLPSQISIGATAKPTAAPAARVLTRRGSTGTIDRSAAAALFSPAAPSGAGTVAGAASNAAPFAAPAAATAEAVSATATQTDPLLDFTKEVVVPEMKSKCTQLLCDVLQMSKRLIFHDLIQRTARRCDYWCDGSTKCGGPRWWRSAD